MFVFYIDGLRESLTFITVVFTSSSIGMFLKC